LQCTHPTGAWKVRGGTVTVVVPAIVGPELYARAHQALEAGRKRGLDRTWHVYLLAKLARCGECGQAIRVRSAAPTLADSPHANLRWSAVARYSCVGRWSPLPPGVVRCRAPYLPVAEADARAWEGICRELEDPALVPALVAERASRAGEVHDWDADVAGYKKHLDRLDGVETALLARFRRGAIGEPAMDAELAALGRERAMLREQVATAERARTATIRATRRLSDAEAIVARLRERLATATPEERRAIVATLVEPGGVTFHGKQIHVEMWVRRPQLSVGETRPAIALVQPWINTHDCGAERLRIRLVA
jgi:hypothetical protein